MPLEDPTGEWKSKPIKLATITIEPQELDLKNQKQLDALAFDPWNALADHRPLGGINRARRRIYEESKKLRHQTNAARQKSMPKGK